MTIETGSLLPQHARLITESAISPDVARARGYRSIETRTDLRRLGFADAQCRVPSLLLPVWDVRGELASYQHRPDAPRIDRRGRAVKYETPSGSRMILDVPPPIQRLVGNPGVPLWITEGIRKADAAVSKGLCCAALLGVWNWRGKNGAGGKTALADWEMVALEGRAVYLAFDSDVMEKPEVYEALSRFKAFLEFRRSVVKIIYLPERAS